MVDPVITSLSQSGLSQISTVPSESAEVFRSPVNPTDVEHFNAAMEPKVQGDLTADAVQPTAQTSDNALMHSIDSLSAASSRMHNEVVQSLSTSGEMGDMFKIQFQVANLTTTQTIVGQTGQKGSQGVQTLLKGQ